MTLSALQSFLAVFFLLGAAAMAWVERVTPPLTGLRDWSYGAAIAGAACLGLWLGGISPDGVDSDTLRAAFLTGALYPAGALAMRGAIRLAHGREHPLLDWAARHMVQATSLLVLVHLMLGVGSGNGKAIYLSCALSAVAAVACIALLRAWLLRDDQADRGLALGLALVSMAGLFILAITMPVTVLIAGKSWYDSVLRAAHLGGIAVALIGLSYAMMWFFFSQHRKHAEQSAGVDVLTGLLNRPGLSLALAQHFCGEHAGPVVLLHLDIDNFDDNDDPAIADRVLCEVARHIIGRCRADDLVARTERQQFLVACVGADSPMALELAERIRTAICTSAIHRVPGKTIHCSVSIGLSAPCQRYGHWQDAARQADVALRRAKSLGSNICISHRVPEAVPDSLRE